MSLFCCCCLALSTLAVANGRRAHDGDVRTPTGRDGGTALFLLTGYKRPLPQRPADPKVAPKVVEVEDEEDPPAVAELPPKPLPQTMLPRNVTADALKPPLGAAQVAPPPRQLVDVDVCRYFLLFCAA